MCGRTGLALCAADVQCACAYKRSGYSKFEKPEWIEEYNFGKKYSPSYNIAPTEITPVLVSANNFGIGENDERLLKPMMWGMVPPWKKDDYKNHGLSTNNCRLEGIMTSKLYGEALRNGNRCIVLAEGFYEWQTANSSKQPYYIYCPQENGIKIEDSETWNNEFSEETGWKGINLMKMAALYNTWSGSEGILYSYSVITLESDSSFNWLHHRVPAILQTEQQVADWLDVDTVSYIDAISIIKPSVKLVWHPVATLVNKSTNKSIECNKPIDPNQISTPVSIAKKKVKPVVGSQKLMNAWLKRSPRKDKNDSDEEQDIKKVKKNL